MKKVYYLFTCMMYTLTVQSAVQIQAPTVQYKNIKTHERHIRHLVTGKTFIKNLFNTATVVAVCYTAIASYREKMELPKSEKIYSELNQTNALQKLVELTEQSVSIQYASDPTGKDLRHWMWNTEETRTTFRKFLLGASIATIAARLGFFEMYQELLGKCSHYDSVTLFLQEKTRVNQLLQSLLHYITIITTDYFKDPHDYHFKSLQIAWNNLNNQIEYLFGYMYYRSGTNQDKKNAVNNLVAYTAAFYKDVSNRINNLTEENNDLLREHVKNFCNNFKQEINNFSNLDAIK